MVEGSGIYPRDPEGRLVCQETPIDRIREVLAAEEEGASDQADAGEVAEEPTTPETD